jgi:hypothetical protein
MEYQMKKQETKPDRPTKFERVYEDDECTSIWKYDLNKFPNGPISVEYKWKAAFLKEIEVRKKRGR